MVLLFSRRQTELLAACDAPALSADVCRSTTDTTPSSSHSSTQPSGAELSEPAVSWTAGRLLCMTMVQLDNTTWLHCLVARVHLHRRPTMYSPHRAMFEVAGPTSFLVDENKRRIAQVGHVSAPLPACTWVLWPQMLTNLVCCCSCRGATRTVHMLWQLSTITPPRVVRILQPSASEGEGRASLAPPTTRKSWTASATRHARRRLTHTCAPVQPGGSRPELCCWRAATSMWPMMFTRPSARECQQWGKQYSRVTSR
jgi:hypothetical protein